MARTRNERKKYDNDRKALLSVVALVLVTVFFVWSTARAFALAM